MNVLNIAILRAGNGHKIWEMTPEERTRKQIKAIAARENIDIHIIDDLARFTDKKILLLRDDTIYDASLLEGMFHSPAHCFVNHENNPIGAFVPKSHIDQTALWLTEKGTQPDIPKLTPDQTGQSYRDELRKKANPYALIVNGDNERDIEWKLFQGSYKGVTDLVTKYLWPLPAFYVTKACAKLRMSPNMVTSIGAVLMFYALYAFWVGDFGPGLMAGWAMTFLDTVDGKLARVTLTSSHWGGIFDHGIDLLHPPFWYLAWAIGLDATGQALPADSFAPLMAAMFGSYIAGRLCEGWFIHRYNIHIHVWRKADSFFRLICARRNPSLIVLTLCWLAGYADTGLIIVVVWHVITLLVHLIQIAQAATNDKRGRPVRSWLQA